MRFPTSAVVLAVLVAVPAHAERLLVTPAASKLPKPKLTAIEVALHEALSSATSAEIVLWEDAANALPPKESKLAPRCKKAPCWSKLAAKTETQLVLDASVIMAKKQPQLTLTLVDANGAELGESVVALGDAPEAYVDLIKTALGELVALPSTTATGNETADSADATVATTSESPDAATSADASAEPAPEVVPGWLGVRYGAATDAAAAYYGWESPLGAWVVKLHPNGPAKVGGIALNDLVVAWNGEPVTDDHALAERLKTASAGEAIVLQVLRGHERVNLTVTLGEKQAWPQ